MANLEDKIKRLPKKPGVYLMKNKEGTIIYVGKAKVLKNRVSQYFHNSANHTPKVLAMISHITDFETIIVSSEREAFVLEANLIKKYKPRYNILLKDDKNYPFIKITVKDDYPRILFTRKIENDGARYFGPYTSAFFCREMIELVKKIFRLVRCNKMFPRDMHKNRPCLYYSMGQCAGVCQGYVESHDYKNTMNDVCDFLDGKHQKLIDKLEAQMVKAAEELKFEQAADLRNKIQSIRHVMQKQSIVCADGKDIDVFCVAAKDNDVAFEVMFIRNGKMVGHESTAFGGAAGIEEDSLMSDFLSQYYARDVFIPSHVFISCPVFDDAMLTDFLSDKKGRKVELRTPMRGEYKKIIDLGLENAKKALSDYQLDMLKVAEKKQTLTELQTALGMDSVPYRIEAYDISNISGTDNVGAMVVFSNGKPDKASYRKFKIKSVQGQNDYDSTKEMIYRRFVHAFSEQNAVIEDEMDEDDVKFAVLPDVIFADGGKGHVAAICEVLSELSLSIPVYGMVKDDKHHTRALVCKDGEIVLKPTSAAFRLITFIQDEVHRTAINYHRSLRKKNMVKSPLLEIPGVGMERYKKLMNHFKSMKRLNEATLSDISAVKGVDKKTAERIYEFLHK